MLGRGTEVSWLFINGPPRSDWVDYLNVLLSNFNKTSLKYSQFQLSYKM